MWQRLGRIDLLVSNAGIGMRTVNPRFLSDPQPFWEVPPDGFRDVLETKLTGCFLIARAVVPLMLEQGSGRIVTISMNEATMVRRGFVPYGPSGAAVEALSRVMAADLADSPVTVNLLLPGGATDTGMVPDDTPAEARERLLDPAVMGPPIVWLASPAGRSPRRADRRRRVRAVAGSALSALLVHTRSYGRTGAAASWPTTVFHGSTRQRVTSPFSTYGSFRANALGSSGELQRKSSIAPSTGSPRAPPSSSSPRSAASHASFRCAERKSPRRAR